uniref:(California timema) hypothetical protein n=1 Tax=Timema californicum TaxID=61474 RepID=A0A7R9P922_TIMCA|nr:unnamed protein product [Timema californicum]
MVIHVLHEIYRAFSILPPKDTIVQYNLNMYMFSERSSASYEFRQRWRPVGLPPKDTIVQYNLNIAFFSKLRVSPKMATCWPPSKRYDSSIQPEHSVLQQATSFAKDGDLLASLQEQHSMAGQPHHVPSVSSSNKKQGVSGESSETGQTSEDIQIQRYDKDFR